MSGTAFGDGFTEPAPSGVVRGGYLCSVYLLGLAGVVGIGLLVADVAVLNVASAYASTH